MSCRGVLSVVVNTPAMHIPPWYWFSYRRTVVSTLHHKLGDDANNPTHILNEPRIGYRMPRAGTAV